jgi:hypothetical protein
MAVRRRQAKQQRQQGKEETGWDFFAFPTLVGFSGGLLLMGFLVLVFPELYFILFLVALFLATFCGSHILFTGTRQRRESTKRSREEEDELERRIVARRDADDASGVTSRRARRRRGKA